MFAKIVNCQESNPPVSVLPELGEVRVEVVEVVAIGVQEPVCFVLFVD